MEECDDGNTSNTDACTNTCRIARCGDGFVREGFEQCDDGNAVNTDACTNACTFARCGDTIVWQGMEECDDGNTSNTDACLNTCVNARCGDGIIRTDLAPGAPGFEACDDGNTSNTDACLNTCVAATCGDGFVHAGVEECDLGAGNANTAACRPGCIAARCGDGFVRAGVEQCDLGAANSNTGACTATCQNAICGDGFVRAGVEQCDTGPARSNTTPNACRLDCTNPRCGDGVVDLGEQCDDGNTIDNDGCRNDCSLPGCGDGVVQAGEQCDLGAANSNTGACTTTCQNAICGDGFVRAGVEQCDTGPARSNTTPNACRLDCTNPRCGDGVVDSGETCDDGNTANGDGCSSTCQIEGCIAVNPALSCNGTVSASNNGPGSTNVVNTWSVGGACATFTYSGPEIVYQFTAPATGRVEALLNFSNAVGDLDLLVIEAPTAGSACSSTAGTCVGASTLIADTERVEWLATAGRKYFIVVDGWGGAAAPFTLRVGAADRHLVLQEIGGAVGDEYIEIRNRSACALDLDPFWIRYQTDCTNPLPIFEFDIPPGSTIAANGMRRLVEGNTQFPSEISMSAPDAICSINSEGHVALCRGQCSASSCSNLIDLVVYDRNLTDNWIPTPPTCAQFNPEPIITTFSDHIHRTIPTGAPNLTNTFQRADWFLAPPSRN
jgi:cysteine-rich repeat protein